MCTFGKMISKVQEEDKLLISHTKLISKFICGNQSKSNFKFVILI